MPKGGKAIKTIPRHRLNLIIFFYQKIILAEIAPVQGL
jgi:hypothetical protein